MILTDSQLRDARDWLAENTWADMEPDDFAALTDKQIEDGIIKFYSGGIEAFVLATFVPPTGLTPQQVATRLCDGLPIDTLMYAADPARMEFRGFAALGDRDDHNMLAVDAGCPEPDGTQERFALIETYFTAISAEIIDRYVKAVVLKKRH